MTRPATQLESWDLMRPKLGEKQAAVLAEFRKADAGLADFELAERLNWPINCVTNRRGELVKKGILERPLRWRRWNTDTQRWTQVYRIKP